MGMRAGILVLAGLMLTGLLVGWRASAPAQAAELELAMGKALFERAWVPAPTSTAAADGLGPLFSGRACTACHSGGGPARVSLAAGGRAQGIVVRFGDAAGRPDPRYGLQLQEHANPGLNPEGRLLLAGEAIRGVVPQPPIRLALNGPPPQAGIRVGLRAAPSLAGRGDLERIDASAALALADPDDRDGDGVSGRPRFIDAPGGGPRRLGRFGWKAAAPDLRTQVATAFALDMGLSSTDVPLPYGDCTVAAADCLAAPTGIRPGDKGQELDEQIISLVTRFVARQTTPRASPDAEGVRLLRASGCGACHVPSLPSGSGSRSMPSPICCCTTWAATSMTGWASRVLPRRNGGRRHCSTWGPATAPAVTCTTAGPPRSPPRSACTEARRPAHEPGLPRCRRPTAADCCNFWKGDEADA